MHSLLQGTIGWEQSYIQSEKYGKEYIDFTKLQTVTISKHHLCKHFGLTKINKDRYRNQQKQL